MDDAVYTYRKLRANMAPLVKEQKVKKQVGVRKVMKKKGLLRTEMIEVDEPVFEEVVEDVPTGTYSDTQINLEDLARRIADTCNELDQAGYDVIKISDIVRGAYNYAVDRYHSVTNSSAPDTCYSYGYGYSVTDGVIIIGKKRAG